MRTYKQLTQEQRYYIFQLNKKDFTQVEIAQEIGVDKSTISRELKRNTGQRGYRPRQAQKKATERRQLASKAIKMTAETVRVLSMFIMCFPQSGYICLVAPIFCSK